MRYWDTLLEETREGFDIIVDKSWEDIPLESLFDTSIDPDTGLPYFDVKDMARKIDRGDLDYFMLRARVLLDGHELGEHIVGGFLYEDAREVLTDGMAEDLIYAAMEEAKQEARRLQGSLQRVIDSSDKDSYTRDSTHYYGA
jgi:hypothetical protein